jgi:hypothetical protein
MKSFREFIEAWSGKTKVTEENVTYSSIQELLGSLDESVKITVKNIVCPAYNPRETIDNQNPARVRTFLKWQFEELSIDNYFTGRHQVFAKPGEEGVEKHYFDLKAGTRMEKGYNSNVVFLIAKKVTLAYVVDDKKTQSEN